MAGVNEINLSPEQKAAESAGQEARVEDFASKLVESLDLPASLAKEVDQKLKEEQEPEKEEETEDTDETESEEESTEDENQSEDSKESEESDEDLIPKSKVQKRIDELTQEKKQLEARLRKAEGSKEQTAPKRDEDLDKLENMSQDALRNLKKQVRLAQIKNASNDDQVAKLMDLEDKIETTMQSAPHRFNERQLGKFREAVNESSSEIQDFDKVAKDIHRYASQIFQNAPELQGSVGGQATAWRLATEHFKALSQVNAGKSKNQELEREVNNLKKKVSLEPSSQKSGSKQSDDSSDKLFKKAKYGTTKDKENFIRKTLNTDSFIPEEYLNR